MKGILLYIGIGYSFIGNMEFEDHHLQLYQYDIRCINGNLQWKDVFSWSFDFKYLKSNDQNPMYGFKNYFDIKFGAGTILLRKNN